MILEKYIALENFDRIAFCLSPTPFLFFLTKVSDFFQIILLDEEYSKVIPPELQQILIDEDILIDAVREQNEHKVKLILDTFKQYNRNKELNDFLQNTNYWGDVLENSHKNESIFNHLMDVFESDEESKICAKNLTSTLSNRFHLLSVSLSSCIFWFNCFMY